MNKDAKNDFKKNILDAVNQRGFNLEFQVEKIISQMQNGIFKFNTPTISKLYDTNEKILELDVFADFWFGDSEWGRGAFYIECKGGHQDTKLLVVDSPKSVYEKDHYHIASKRCRFALQGNKGANGSVKMIHDKFICHTTYANPNPFLVHNGDFFEPQNNKHQSFKVCSKQIEKSNLYKGINQLEATLLFLENKGFAEDIIISKQACKANYTIFPLLIVRADIYVVRYELENNSNKASVYGSVPWVGYRSRLSRNFVALDKGLVVPSIEAPVYFLIVNIDHFKTFLEQFNNTDGRTFIYPKKPNQIE